MQHFGAEIDNKFGVVDYVVFGVMLVMSVIIGIYYGLGYGQKKARPAVVIQDEEDAVKVDDYLTANKTLSPVPVAMSLIASYVSGVTVLGTPAEVYNYGTQYWLIFISIWLMGYVVSTVYIPVYDKIKCKSAYEYLELRFGKHVRTFISCMFVFDEILFLPMVVYVPALAFNQVTGLNLYLVSLVVSIVCIFYTTIGGLKAVVWTDAWQVLVMIVSELLIVILGTYINGGIEEIWDRASVGDRLQFFNLNPSMYERQSFWAVLIGGFMYWTAFNSVNQTMVQRYVALPSLKKARQSMAIFTLGVSIFVWICCYSGLVVYATYWKCDPLAAGVIKTDDQLLPVFVMQVLGHIPGMPGIFIAAVFGAGLSSMSVVLNSAASVILEDILKGAFKLRLKGTTAVVVVKLTIVILGTWTFVAINIVERMGGVLGVATSLTAIAAGTSCGIFTLGMLFPFANTKGAIVGGFSGAFLAGWVSLGSQISSMMGIIKPIKLAISVEECVGNVTLPIVTYPDESGVFPLYRLSFHWITPIGLTTVIVVGVIVSLLTRDKKAPPVHPDFLSPVVHRFLSKEVLEAGKLPPTVRLLQNS